MRRYIATLKSAYRALRFRATPCDMQLSEVESAHIPLLCNVGLNDVIIAGALGLPLEHQDNYLLQAAAAINETNGDIGAAREIIGAHMASFQPKTGADLLLMGASPGGRPLDQCEALCTPLPWDGVPSEALKVKRFAEMVKEAKEHGAPPEAGGISNFCGPAPRLKVKLEALRLARLLASVRRQGYLASRDPKRNISGRILRRADGASKVLIKNGQHRMVVLRALDYTQAPVLITGIVEARGVVCWPMVQAGVCSREEGLGVFDRLFGADVLN